jgi:hypothetical protein
MLRLTEHLSILERRRLGPAVRAGCGLRRLGGDRSVPPSPER